jgi:hypothetical protein
VWVPGEDYTRCSGGGPGPRIAPTLARPDASAISASMSGIVAYGAAAVIEPDGEGRPEVV